MHPCESASPILHFSFSASASGATAAITAAVGKKFRIVDLVLCAAATVTVKAQDGATDLTGAMTLIAGVPFSPGLNMLGYFTDGTANTAFNLNLGGNVAVNGYGSYQAIG